MVACEMVNACTLIDLLCLTPLSAIFQLYHGDHFSGGRSLSTRREPPTIKNITNNNNMKLSLCQKIQISLATNISKAPLIVH
jgi:hypothetical protein